LKVETATAKLKKYKSPGSDQIPAEQVQAGGEILQYEIHKFINSIWNKEDLPDQGRSLLLYQFTRRGIKLTVVLIGGYNCYQLHTKFCPISFSQGCQYMKLLCFDLTNQLLIRSFAFVRYWRKNGSTMRQYISHS
jgi:hypothetical protein